MSSNRLRLPDGSVSARKKMEFYMKNNKLPSPCDECYKALIFWEGTYSEENVTYLLDMINSFDFD